MATPRPPDPADLETRSRQRLPGGLNVGVTDEPDLSDWLAGRPADQLAEILAHRPDAFWGAPLHGLQDLGSRLLRPASIARAVAALPLPGFQLVHALVALGPRPTLVSAAALLARGSRSAAEHQAAVKSILELLEQRALAWTTADGVIAVNPGVRVVIDEPLGLGRTVAGHLEHTATDQLQSMVRTLGLSVGTRRAAMTAGLTRFLTDPLEVQALLTAAPDAAAARLLSLAADRHSNTHHPRNQLEREGDNWARRRGLLYGGQYYEPDMPVEVILAVLGDGLTVNFHPDPPVVATRPVTSDSVVAAAAAAAGEIAETVAALIDAMTRAPIPALKSGGVGTREVTRTAKQLGVDDVTVRLALELVRDVGLLGGTLSGVGAGEAAGPWRSGDPSARFADLAVAWWGLPVTPTISRNEEGKALPALGGRIADGSAMDLRWSVLAAIAALGTGVGVAEKASLVQRMNWQSPGLVNPEDPAITAIWAEAHTLGVLAQGALTPIGSALIDRDPDGLLAVAEALLAPAATVGTFGSDLTVMVAGSPSAAVSALLDSCADRESRGAAVVWRFSPVSVRRALDEGVTADELLLGLRAIADTELPQPLTYLIGDVRRRHGNLVVLPALCCVRSQEESLLVEVAAHRGLRALRPFQLAPTVLSFQADPDAVLTALRTAGYLPVPADDSGVIYLRRRPGAGVAGARPDLDDPGPVRDRLRDLGSDGGAEGAGRPSAALVELAAELLAVAGAEVTADVAAEPAGASAGDDPMATAQLIEVFGSQLAPIERRQLVYAIDHQLPVEITYRSGTGGITTRTISDIELDLNQLRAWCHLRDDERVFAVDRVIQVMPARS